MALGADGTNRGTRFCATREAPIHQRVKQFIIDDAKRIIDDRLAAMRGPQS